MRIRTFGLLVLGMLISVGTGVAQQATVFSFLRFNQSARFAGLAGASTALSGDPTSIFMNPGALPTVEGQRVSATFLKHVLDINSGLAAYVDYIDGFGTVGASVIATSFGSFERSTSTGDRVGSFSAADVAIGVSYANEIDTLITYGVTLKFISSTLDDMASTGLAVDAGVLFRLPDGRTNVGMSIMHLGTQLSTYDGTSDRLPVDVRLGINHRLRGLPLLMNVSINHLADEVDGFFDRFLNFSIGGELYIGKAVQLRAGYDNATRNMTGVNVATQLSGVSAGIGLLLKPATVDYALSSLGSSAMVHRLSVGLTL